MSSYKFDKQGDLPLTDSVTGKGTNGKGDRFIFAEIENKSVPFVLVSFCAGQLRVEEIMLECGGFLE